MEPPLNGEIRWLTADGVAVLGGEVSVKGFSSRIYVPVTLVAAK